jgi:hypothetical protein
VASYLKAMAAGMMATALKKAARWSEIRDLAA